MNLQKQINKNILFFKYEKKLFYIWWDRIVCKKFAELIIKKGVAKKIIIFSRDEYKQMMMKELPFVKNNLKILNFI